MYWLQIMRGAELVAKFRLTAPRLVLGRAPDCDILLQNRGVSRHHAQLEARGEDWLIQDLGSLNGVYVNGARITGPYLIGPGDTVQLDVFQLALYRELELTTRSDGVFQATLEMAPPRPMSGLLSALVSFNGALLSAQGRDHRELLLCQLMTDGELRGRAALFLALSPGDPKVAPRLRGTPVIAHGELPEVSPALLRSALAGRGAVVSATRQIWHERDGDAGERDLGDVEMALAILVDETDDEIVALYVTLPDACETAEWRTLVTVAVTLFRQAEEVWSVRGAMEAQALLRSELERARELQMRLIARDFRAGRFDIAFGFVPCKGVGGDYIDALSMTDGRVLLVAMDVAGKGMDAALIASGLHTTVHIGATQWFSLVELITTLNRYLIATWDVLTSVTVSASVLDPRSGVVESINCGHPSPLVVGADRRVRELAAFETVPLGIMELDLATRTDRLRPGELLAYYSDGLSEQFNEVGEMLGTDGVAARLARALAEAGPRASAPELVQDLLRRMAEFRGHTSPGDDVSLLLALAGS